MSDLLRKAFRLGFEASGEGYNGEYPFEGYNVNEDEEWCEMRDRALAPLAAPVAAPVQVKALDWKDSEWSDTYAACLIGAYVIKKDFTLILIDDGIIGHFDSAKDAKAAAQADYETRIRSALISGDTSNG